MIDSNSYFLDEYHSHQDRLEHQWVISLPEVREAVCEYAKKLLKGLCDESEFEYAFIEYIKDSGDYDFVGYQDKFDRVLDDWLTDNLDPEDLDYLQGIVLAAIEGSAMILYDKDIHDICEDGYKISDLINEVISE